MTCTDRTTSGQKGVLGALLPDDEVTAPIVLVTSRSFATGDFDLQAELEAAGAVVLPARPDHDLESLRAPLATVAAWIAGTGPITAEHLDLAPQLRLIARYGVGLDGVDLSAAAQRGITVTNTPGANSSAVADHAVALMLAALRGVTRGDRQVRAADWSNGRLSRGLGSLVVGIVGVGRIGREVAKRLSGFGSALLGHDPYVTDQDLQALGIEPVDLLEVATRSDIVTLHCPGTSTLVDADWLAAAKPGMLLVNTARAILVDEAAVAAALRSGALGGYAADTLSTEVDAGSGSPLLGPDLADLTIFTPHTAAQTIEAIDRMGHGVTDAVLAVLRGETPHHLVLAPGTVGAVR